MARYFNRFPKTYYSFDNFLTADYVTNIIARFSLENKLKDNTSVFYKYAIRDGDTPENIAYKMYGSSERHWIVLAMNDIIDPQSDWPMQYESLNSYIDKKYMESANSTTSGAGISWASANIHSYYRVETTRMPKNVVDTKKLEVDANTYADIIVSSDSLTLEDGTVVTIETTKETKSFYDYEHEVNDAKREIKLIKEDFVDALEQEFQRVFL